uniref:Flavonoid glycosyltransferase UGT94C2 n=1 Tax=Veronica persica TaxID=138560 RepID=C9K5X9_VERPE|nr:flavonoid glycosyltransferase UGT94C2 [Veronica persica]
MSVENSFKILMFPWLAHGHVFPYLELAKRILKGKNFQIYICSTPINFTSINTFINKNLLENSIQLVDIQLQPSEELPPHYHTPKNLPPNLLFTLINAFQSTHSNFSNIIATLKPDLVIYDIFQPWAAKISSLQGIPAVHFASIGAGVLSFIHHHYTPSDIISTPFPFPVLQCKDHEVKSIEKLLEFLYENLHDVDQDFLFGSFKHSCNIVLVKTSRSFEQKYMNYIQEKCKKRIVSVGPLVSNSNNITNEEDSESIIQWLNSKSLRSTVYISFGSEYFLNDKEVEEIAKGLELCDANFIWVIRFPAGDKTISLENTLPRGFLNRVKDRGLVVEGWAPQVPILAHSSIACFASHCGWSSLMESLYYGVPVIAMPMQFDQPINARLAGEGGFSLEVDRDENGMLSGENIAKGINTVFEEKTGEELRFRAKEVSEKMRRDEEEDLDEVIDQLLLLCKNYKLQE